MRPASALLLALAAGCATAPAPEVDLVTALVRQNDEAVARRLPAQQRDPAHRAFGGIADADGLYHAGATAGFIRDAAAAWVAPGSRFHRDRALLAPLLDAARFMRSIQHPDGTIDLITTNFHSPPDTGFVLEWMCGAAGLLRDLEDPALDSVRSELRAFIEKAGQALVVGGIHTPNHRWVVCMALARCNALFPDPRYVARIDEWLAEGIDIDPDGQFTERSTSIYSPLTDRCLITVARLLDRPALLEPVRRNLEMTLYYLHPSGEVATEGSRRQDQHRPGMVTRYHYPYRFMALHDGDGRFAALARWMERTHRERLTGSLVYLLESPELGARLPPSAPLPEDYERAFLHSGLVRIRRGPLSATILADNPTFFSLHKGGAALVVRVGSAFFGKGQFTGADLRREGDAWTLRQELDGPYWQPLSPEQRVEGDSWSAVPRTARAQSEVQRLTTRVAIREAGGGFDLEFEVTGTDGVPVAIELGCRSGGTLSGVDALAAPGSFLAAAPRGSFQVGRDRIGFGPGRAEHRWVQLRGALPKVPGDSVYLTGSTPFRHTLQLR